MRDSSIEYSHRNTAACSSVATAKRTNRGSGRATMTLRAEQGHQETHDRLREPAHTDNPARQRVLDDAADRAAQQRRDRTGRHRHVDDGDQHQIDPTAAADQVPGQGGLQRQRERDGDRDPGRLHGVSPRGTSGARRVVTTSTSSSASKSTTGRTPMSW